MRATRAHLAIIGLALFACSEKEPDQPPAWQVAARTPSAALMAVHGTAADDVWLVGADDGAGPLVLHFDGNEWTRMDLGVEADLWWVHAVSKDHVLFGGSDATLVVYDGEGFVRQKTPGLGRTTVFGVWGATEDDVYAVGAEAGRNGFIWHYDGASWRDLPLPENVPQNAARDVPPLFKVSGHAPDDAWIVGDRGVVLRGGAAGGFSLLENDTSARLFTVHCSSQEALIVGGNNEAAILGSGSGSLLEHPSHGMGLLQGAFVGDDGSAWITGQGGTVYRRAGESFVPVETGLEVEVESLHAVWVDPSGGVWTVGGGVLTGDLLQGVALHRPGRLRDRPVPLYEEVPTEPSRPQCPAGAVDPAPHGSMARRWNEQLLNAIRRDLPRPTVHARNLYHLSLAQWDAWAAYDPESRGILTAEALEAADVHRAREEAIAYASFRILSARYGQAVGGGVSSACFEAFLDGLGYDANDESGEGSTPRALGNRIAQAVLDHFSADGSNAEEDYLDPNRWTPDNPPLVVDEPGTVAPHPLWWQQMVLAEAVTQNGITEGAGVRTPVGPHWGQVTPFALVRPAPGQPYFSPPHPPVELDAALRDAIVDVIARAAELDVADGVLMDISPGAYGNNPLGSDSGTGHPENPATMQPYAENRVLRGDFVRILAEYWADGPSSETPPGHWNTLANHLADNPGNSRRLFGVGEPLDPLAWDVHVYLALNGAVHDAAIAAWELKRHYHAARPITLVRHFGSLGQSSDPEGPSYHPDGLPLVPGLIEVITVDSSRPGARHAHLARYVGEIALFSWRGEPGDRKREHGGVAWIRAADWIPYQRRTFVTPPFPGYISGHSTFSRAAAEVLTTITGSQYFPGGMGSARFDPGYLVFEAGPSEPVVIQWATYYDAADQAGQSRIWGGIHIVHDDYDGRLVGSQVGLAAIARAREYFAGSP